MFLKLLKILRSFLFFLYIMKLRLKNLKFVVVQTNTKANII